MKLKYTGYDAKVVIKNSAGWKKALELSRRDIYMYDY
jgi:hypothetical protein